MDEDGFGTAIGALDGTAWYTLDDGTLSEVFAPAVVACRYRTSLCPG